MHTIYKEFGDRLRQARVNAGLTQGEVARRVGLSRTSITNIERGNQVVPLHLLYAVADATGVEVMVLLPHLGEQRTADVVPSALLRGLEEDDRRWVQRVVQKGVARRGGGHG